VRAEPLSLETLYELLVKEINAEEIQRVDVEIYRKIAEKMAEYEDVLRSRDKDDVYAKLAREGQELYFRIFALLFDIRVRKLLKKELVKPDFPLPEEERIVCELSKRALNYAEAVKRAVRGGNTVLLTKLSRRSKERRILVVRGGIPSFMGADLKVYGPFRDGDVTALPEENISSLVKQSKAAFVGVDEFLEDT